MQNEATVLTDSNHQIELWWPTFSNMMCPISHSQESACFFRGSSSALLGYLDHCFALFSAESHQL